MNIRFTIAISLWLASICGGIFSMVAFDNVPGETAVTPTKWPESTELHLTPGRSTLVMALHPNCECSKASLEELAQVAARFSDRLDSKLLFYSPSKLGDDWRDAGLWDIAAHIPNAELLRDIDGNIAKLFGAATSGHVVLYDETGTVAFSGGITAARGHFGDNTGQSSIIAILSGHEPPAKKTPAFGCHIFSVSKPRTKSQQDGQQ